VHRPADAGGRPMYRSLPVIIHSCSIDPAGAAFGGFYFDPGLIGDAVAEVDLLGRVGDFVEEVNSMMT